MDGACWRERFALSLFVCWIHFLTQGNVRSHPQSIKLRLGRLSLTLTDSFSSLERCPGEDISKIGDEICGHVGKKHESPREGLFPVHAYLNPVSSACASSTMRIPSVCATEWNPKRVHRLSKRWGEKCLAARTHPMKMSSSPRVPLFPAVSRQLCPCIKARRPSSLLRW